MIRPNPFATAQRPTIQPGMGYVSHMGYAPGARFSHLGYLPGTLGDISPSMQELAVDSGIQQSDVDLLNSLGATDSDIEAVVNGNITLAALYADYGVTIPAANQAAASAPPTTPASAAATAPPTVATGPIISQPAAQIPSGSTILYTCTYNPVPSFTSASTVVADIAAQLAAHGMSMISNAVQASGLTSNASFTMTILDSVGNNLVSDAKSILDSLVNQYTSNELVTSSVTVVSPGTTASGTPAAGTPAAAASTATQWLENNAVYIGLGLVALVLLNNFTSKKR
jgi:hypothetical protein